ncbi:MAG: hypothetical protein NTZ35_19675 [Ignavibacteriales bacterium]|nr:hypothetical protein [Ignavibacteriales bacterium]
MRPSRRKFLNTAALTMAGVALAPRETLAEYVPDDASILKGTPMSTFPWLRNLSDFFVGSLRNARHFDREAYIRQLADQGFTHVSINGLGADRPFESGPPGDVYSWFYDYSPDLDQFVTSKLIDGFYPEEYLRKNLEFLKSGAALAMKYGVVPGLHVNSPRSMPEKFWEKCPFLRGARIDHPRESFRPRYTLAMAHPVVQQHYRELVHNLMKEVPQLGFIHVWTNDSGSGFEFVASLYAGRNGGPYLIREWKSDDEIARRAAENVLTYYHLLRDQSKKLNPAFRVICDLGPFYAERKYIAPGLGDGLDAGEFASFEKPESREEREMLNRVGAVVHQKLDLGDNNVLGVPCPKLVYERLQGAAKAGATHVMVGVTPRSLAPFDINGDVLQAFQQNSQTPLEDVINASAERWVGSAHAQSLRELWALSDTAVRSYPFGIPYSTFAFPWFRLWIRPFVPNIDTIPESDRLYYERYLLATFNNPARIDLNNDMMWNFLTVEEAGEKKRSIDRSVIPPLSQAVARSTELLQHIEHASPAGKVFQDLHDRLCAAQCYYRTMRNTVAWTESVHGYMEAKSQTEKQKFRELCREMVVNELDNARNLLKLWTESHVDWMPVTTGEESLHIYADNFGDHVRRKIELMNRHATDEPYIDPNYMWRMPKE